MSSFAQFGLDGDAFASESGPESYVECESHRRALAHLRHGLKQAEGVVILTGDQGVGKTEIFKKICAETEGRSPEVLLVDGDGLTAENIEARILSVMNITDPGDDSLADIFVSRREEGKSYALFFDNAECLSDETLEKIRQLSVQFHDGEALVQISLAGDTPMRSILYKESMDRFRQRVIASYHLPAMNGEEVRDYLRTRVSAAGGEVEKLFSTAAIEALIKHSGGLPGNINRLATRAIELAANRQNDHVAGKDVSAAAEGAMAEPKSDRPSDEPGRVTAIQTAAGGATPAELTPAKAEEEAAPTLPSKRPVAVNPIDRINGRRIETMAKASAGAKENVSPDEINSAIESLGSGGQTKGETPTTSQQSSAPTPSRRRGISPQELMLAKPSSPLVAKPEPQKTQKPDQPTPEPEKEDGGALIASTAEDVPSFPPAPEPEGDLWDPASSLEEGEAEQLDRLAFEPVRGPDTLAPEIDAFLSDAREKLDSLRATLKTLRAETEKLDTRRREMREKVSGRIEELQQKLDGARSER